MKSIFLLFVSFCFISCLDKIETKSSHEPNNSTFASIYPFALRGEMQNAFSILDTINEEKLNKHELELKEKYYSRFINETEKFDYRVEDSTVITFVDMYHSYWKENMIQGVPIHEADSLFMKSMAHYLFTNTSEKVALDSIENNLYKYSNDFLKERGYFSNAFGKTGHLYDLFLWKENRVKNYTVELIDETVAVTVHLMDDFISTGWSYYTTFGRSYASGWANREALFCVVSAYNLESENFKISYLTHEGQHFSDYQRYPKLKQKDLEYRAKLLELTKSTTTTTEIIHKFITNASSTSENAHAFANYCVIRDLSQAVFNKNYIAEEDAWKSIDSELISEKSKMLFYRNSKKLDSIGSDVVTEYIK